MSSKRIDLTYGFSTHAIHAGEAINDTRSHINPVFQTSTFKFANAEEGHRMFAGEHSGYVYSRLGNPTVELLETKVAALEGKNLIAQAEKRGEQISVYAIAFASGMSAISTVALSVLSPGDHLVTDNILYGCTNSLFMNTLPRMQIGVTYVDCSNPEHVQRALEEHPNTKMVYLETPANPTMKLSDIAAIAELCEGDIRLVVDNTFATPMLQRPLELGADIVIHSTTKYISGHGIALGGMAISTDKELFDNSIYPAIIDTGGNPSPHDAWLINMGLKTLAIRMERHCRNALEIAHWLEQHPKVERVYYPGLPSHPQKELAERQMNGFGGIISFTVKGGLESAQQVLDHVVLCTLAVSLGCVDSLIQHPYTMTHNVVPEDVKNALGISKGLVRLSVGIEDAADIMDDLDMALSHA